MMKILTYAKTPAGKWKNAFGPQFKRMYLDSILNSTVYDKLQQFKKLTNKKRSTLEK